MPGIVKEGNFIWFGTYPQSRKLEDVRIVSQNDRGYYVGTDGYQYAAMNARDGQGQFAQAGGSLLYYKVEPIKWRIIGDKTKGVNRNLTLLCEVVLDALPFQDNVDQLKNKFTATVGDEVSEANDWAFSSVRRWLNGEFAERAFPGDMFNYVVRTQVETDGYRSLERVYLPSRRVAKSYRIVDCVFSDYALYRSGNCGDIWLREAGSHSGNAAFEPKGKEDGKSANVVLTKGILPIVNLMVQA